MTNKVNKPPSAPKRKRKKTAVWISQYRNRVIIASVVLSLVVLAGLITLNGSLRLPFLPTWDGLFSGLGLRSAPLPEGDLRVTVMDVGNADAILVECDGHTLLIDAGENDDEKTVVSQLKKAGVTSLDYVIATHADADHIGGMDAVIREFPIGTFYMSFMPQGYTPTTVTYENMLTAMAQQGVQPIDPAVDTTFALGEATVTVLSGRVEYTETNDQSVVCLVTHGEMDFLFTGDAGKEVEQELLRAYPTLKIDVLKVGHHGSRTSSDGEFIRRLAPKYAVITCGYRNSYGHPHSETLQTLKRNNIRVYRSDLNGTITMTSDGKTVEIQAERDG